MATITSCEVNYRGSIAVDPKLLKAADILEHEMVHVLNFRTAARFTTYAIKGKPGEIGLRGPAAKLGKVGDKVIILTYVQLEDKKAKKWKPKIILAGNKNKIIK